MSVSEDFVIFDTGIMEIFVSKFGRNPNSMSTHNHISLLDIIDKLNTLELKTLKYLICSKLKYKKRRTHAKQRNRSLLLKNTKDHTSKARTRKASRIGSTQSSITCDSDSSEDTESSKSSTKKIRDRPLLYLSEDDDDDILSGSENNKQTQPAPVGEDVDEKQTQPASVGEDVDDKQTQPASVGADVDDKQTQPASVGADVDDTLSGSENNKQTQPAPVGEDVDDTISGSENNKQTQPASEEILISDNMTSIDRYKIKDCRVVLKDIYKNKKD